MYGRLLNIKGSKYVRVPNVPRLYRVLNMLEYAWICLNNARICVNTLAYLLTYFENA